MADQDWDTVTVLRKRAPNKSTMKSDAAVNQARRQGTAIDTQQKCKYRSCSRSGRRHHPLHHYMPLICPHLLSVGAASNRQHVTTKNTAKLDRETEELRHATVSNDTGKLIMQGRQNKGLSQKDLATVSVQCRFLQD